MQTRGSSRDPARPHPGKGRCSRAAVGASNMAFCQCSTSGAPVGARSSKRILRNSLRAAPRFARHIVLSHSPLSPFEVLVLLVKRCRIYKIFERVIVSYCQCALQFSVQADFCTVRNLMGKPAAMTRGFRLIDDEPIFWQSLSRCTHACVSIRVRTRMDVFGIN
jgi:hypothetical protein